jgi:type II secretory ATPase GspE/PulE/Tfp pilus assembly ATPase PilB-like protein
MAALMPIRDVYEPEMLQALAKKLPRHVAEKNEAVLLELTAEGIFVVGMLKPGDMVSCKNIAMVLRVPASKCIPRHVTPERLVKLHLTAYGAKGIEVHKGDEEFEDLENHNSTRESINWELFDPTATSGSAQAEQPALETDAEIGLGTGLRAAAEKVILEAISRRASDIHVIPGPVSGHINCRIDGQMYELIPNIPANKMENLANAFSDMAGVNGYELLQRGMGAEINITIRTAAGNKEKMTLRFHGRRSIYGRIIIIRINRAVFRNFGQIGLERCQDEEIQKSLEHKNGLILVTGPTGSGKSNTLEAMLRKLELYYKFRKHVIQIGNPIEFPNPRRTQLPVDSEEDWGVALKDAMRMDPDIFSPGEFRDAEEAAIVFQGAATGHLTLTTLHTNNVAQTFSRLDFLGIGRDKQGDLIRLIVSQELVPVLCNYCKKPDPRGREIAERLVEIVFPNRPDLKEAINRAQGVTPFFHAEGCAVCHDTGIKGRTCIAEALRITPDIGRMLRKGADGEEIVDYAVRNYGMMTLAEAAARKLCRGIISYDHVAHLLISTNQAAPESNAHAWDTSYDKEASAAAQSTETQSASSTPYEHAPQTDTEESYIEAEIIYAQRPQPAEHRSEVAENIAA